MFSPFRVMEAVKRKLSAMRNFDEETFHQAYMKEMNVELDGIKGKLESLQLTVEARRASHQEQGWIMVSPEQQKACIKLIEQLKADLR